MVGLLVIGQGGLDAVLVGGCRAGGHRGDQPACGVESRVQDGRAEGLGPSRPQAVASGRPPLAGGGGLGRPNVGSGNLPPGTHRMRAAVSNMRLGPEDALSFDGPPVVPAPTLRREERPLARAGGLPQATPVN